MSQFEEYQPTPQTLEAEQLRNFYERIFQATPRAFVTIGIVAVNVAVFVAMLASGGGLFNPPEAVLLKFGANYGPLTAGGQWWRLLTCMFEHIGIIHIALNMLVFWQVGRFVERLLGNAGFLILYLVAGLCGSIASLLWNRYVLSAGASGAVFGVYGGLLGFMALRRDSVPSVMLKKLVNGILAFLGYNVIFGLSVRGIDMAAHIGGFTGGLVCGLVMSQPLSGSLRAGRLWRSGLAALLGVAAVSATVLKLPAPPEITGPNGAIAHFNAVHHVLMERSTQEAIRADKDEITGQELARAIEQDILPRWREERNQIAAISGYRMPGEERKLLLRMLAYIRERERAWALLAKGLATNDEAVIQQGQAAGHLADQLLRQINAPVSRPR